MSYLLMFILGGIAALALVVPYIREVHKGVIRKFTEPGPGVSISPDGRYAIVRLDDDDT